MTTFNPADFEITVRGIEPSYIHTLARTANREVSNQETHLAAITVEVHLRAARSCDSDYDGMFELEFTVDHEAEQVRFKTVGDAYDERSSFDPEKFQYVTAFGGRVVNNWLDSVGVSYEPPNRARAQLDRVPKPTVHTELSITEDDDG